MRLEWPTAASGRSLLAMEYIAGQTLIEYVKEQRLDVRARLELMAKICDAMNDAHRRGMIHRDLKPVNILVDQTGRRRFWTLAWRAWGY